MSLTACSTSQVGHLRRWCAVHPATTGRREGGPGEPTSEEFILFLSAATYAAAVRRAGGEDKLDEAARGSWNPGPTGPTQAELGRDRLRRVAQTTEAAQGALDRMLKAYAELPVYDGDLAELFTAALLAVPVRAGSTHWYGIACGRRGRQG